MEPLEASSSIAKKHGTHNKYESTSYSNALQQKLSIRGQRFNQKKPSLTHLDVLPGMSANSKRLYSTAKFIPSNTRKRTSLKLFETLLLLKVKRSYWNTYSIGKSIERTGEDKKLIHRTGLIWRMMILFINIYTILINIVLWFIALMLCFLMNASPLPSL